MSATAWRDGPSSGAPTPPGAAGPAGTADWPDSPTPAGADDAESAGPGLTEGRVLDWCLWCAPLFTVLLFAGLIVAGFLPPPAPALSADQVAALYAEHTDLKRIGFAMIFVGGGLTAPLVGAIHRWLRRIPGAGALAVMQVIGGTTGVIAVTLPAIVLMVAAYRPERDPQVTAALHDLAVIPFIGNFVPFLVQAVAIGTALLMQPSGREALPRWLGWFNLWVAFLTLPGILLVFVRGGPFAWNGAFVFWVVAVVFGSWFWVMFAVLRTALHAEKAGAAS